MHGRKGNYLNAKRKKKLISLLDEIQEGMITVYNERLDYIEAEYDGEEFKDKKFDLDEQFERFFSLRETVMFEGDEDDIEVEINSVLQDIEDACIEPEEYGYVHGLANCVFDLEHFIE